MAAKPQSDKERQRLKEREEKRLKEWERIKPLIEKAYLQSRWYQEWLEKWEPEVLSSIKSGGVN